MKKKIRLLGCLCFVVLLLFSVNIGVLAETTGNDAYDNMMESFGTDENGNYQYPEDYAGAYLEEDQDKLVILLTDNANKDEYQKLAGEDANLDFKIVEYSYQELEEYGKTYREKLEADGAKIASHGVDILRNSYTFGITADQETIDALPTVQSIKEESLPIICETSGEIVAATSSESSSESSAMIMISIPMLAVICIAFGLLLIAVVILLARRNRK